MASFRSAKDQAEFQINKKLKIGHARHGQSKTPKGQPTQRAIHSLGTQRNYTQALTNLTTWLRENKLGDLKKLTKDNALKFLELRSEAVGQKTLNQERQAIQLYLGVQLPVVKSELEQVLKSRAYSQDHVGMIVQAQSDRHRLATQIAVSAGLRAHELLTLQSKDTQQASKHRRWSKDRFTGREGKLYTVRGKGGLIREVMIPTTLATQLEAKKLNEPRTIRDRTIDYMQYYDIGGGSLWSNSFSAASTRALGWSNGAHGLRHTYAQMRMRELQQHGFLYEDALAVVSQELGHFRPDITKVYLH
ncbi:MAG: hypothetical protein K0R98_1059 [Rickettsiaceae bacterium]|jgi:integrase|nr:hypothetical protein [Rickettsiaceae bacterium]